MHAESQLPPSFTRLGTIRSMTRSLALSVRDLAGLNKVTIDSFPLAIRKLMAAPMSQAVLALW